MNFSMIVTGTAEQPVFWAGQVLSKVAFNRGYNVYFSGSPEARAGKGVMAHVRWGEGILSPVVPQGDCQLVIGLEPLEAVRVSLDHNTPNMQVVSTAKQILPTSVTHQEEVYPDISSIFRRFEDEGISTKLVNFSSELELKEVAIRLFSEVKLEEKLMVELEELITVLKEMGENDLVTRLLGVRSSS